jgi:hypothetical protein
MKFFFLQRKRYKAIYGELCGVLGEAAVDLATVKCWHQCFKAGNFSRDDETSPRRLLCDLAQIISQFLRDESILSACVRAKRRATSPRTIKMIVARDPGMAEI